jgi:putative flavoprotein involved in K+ transport
VLSAVGAMRKSVDSRIGRRLKDREMLIGSSPRRARRQGIQLRNRAIAADDRAICFADGTELAPGSVVWATGFVPDHGWIDVPVFDSSGAPIHERGVTPAPGLYFLGLPWQHTRGSALLGWVEGDAGYVAGRIATSPSHAPAVAA